MMRRTEPSHTATMLSLVIPCYNEQHRLAGMLEALARFDREVSFAFEVIIVDDGSTDETVAQLAAHPIYQSLQQKNKCRLIRLPHNKGKGAALQAGVAVAAGTHILTLDADMATHPVELLRWLSQKRPFPSAQVIYIGSREHPQSRVSASRVRRLIGRIFNLFVRGLTPLHQRDTQCGFKLYEASTAKYLFARQRTVGWAHDIELLMRAHLHGITIQELPVSWQAVPGSKIQPLRDGLRMFLSLVATALWVRLDYFFLQSAENLRSNNIPEPFNVSRHEAWGRLLFAATLIVLFFLMSWVSFDYGITGDELDQKIYGEKVLDYFLTLGKDTSCFHLKVGNKENLHLYGGLFNMTAAAAHRMFPSMDPYDVRHLLNAWTGWLTILFAGLLARWFNGWMTAWLAVLLLASWPMFFGHSMNNPKDVPFALGYVWAIYYLFRLVGNLPRPARYDWIMLAAAIAFTINIRVGGLVLLAVAAVFIGTALIGSPFLRRQLFQDTKTSFTLIRNSLLLVGTSYFGGLLFWPYGLVAPFTHPWEALREMSNFSVGIRVLFHGKWIMSDQIPWSYVPVWLGITAPLVVMAGWLFLPLLLRSNQHRMQVLLLIFSWLFPWLYIVLKQSPLYDSIRQVLFLVPLLAVTAALGWQAVLTRARPIRLQYVLVVLLGAGLLLPIRFAVANHPNQYVYFNELIGGIRGAFGKYDTDYYMNSLRKTAEWFRESAPFAEATREKKLLLATNALDPVNWYFRNDTDRVSIVFVKWHAPGNPKTRGARRWDYGLFFSRDVEPSMLRSGHWPSKKAIYVNQADGVPLSAVIARGPDWDAQGYQALQRDSLQQARTLLIAALKDNPQNEEAAYWLTQTHLALNQLAEARTAALHYLSMVPETDQGYVLLAIVEARQGNTASAVNYLHKALRINEGNPQANYLMAVLYEQAGDQSNAAKYMQRFRTLQP